MRINLFFLTVASMIAISLANVYDNYLTTRENGEQRARLSKLRDTALTHARNLMSYSLERYTGPGVTCVEDESVVLKRQVVKTLRSITDPLAKELDGGRPLLRPHFLYKMEQAAKDLRVAMFLTGLKWSIDVEYICKTKLIAEKNIQNGGVKTSSEKSVGWQNDYIRPGNNSVLKQVGTISYTKL